MRYRASETHPSYSLKPRVSPCAHCESDSHTSVIRDSVIQLRGVNLCQIHYDTAVMVRGHLLSPDTARELESLLNAE